MASLVFRNESLADHLHGYLHADCDLLYWLPWLPWNSNNGFLGGFIALLGSPNTCRGSLKIKFRRQKRPCAYYANSNATFHPILDVGDLVFKLNPGPDNRITTIVSSNRMVKNGHLWSRHSLPKGANLHDLRSLDRISVAPKFSFNKEFTSCLMNAHSLCNKTLIVKEFVVDYKVDLLGITETWLHVEGSEVTIGELCPSGHRLLHPPRSAGRGGGVGLLYKQGIGSKIRLFEHSFTLFECIVFTFVARKCLRVIVVYHSPGCAPVGVFLEEFSSLLQETVICPEELLIYGYFNFHMDDKADWDTTRFGELLDLFNLKQHACVPTHKCGHILDLVITRNETESALGLKNVTVMEQFISDHKAVCVNLNLQKPLNERMTVVSRILKGFDFDAFNDMIGLSGLSDGCIL